MKTKTKYKVEVYFPYGKHPIVIVFKRKSFLGFKFYTSVYEFDWKVTVEEFRKMPKEYVGQVCEEVLIEYKNTVEDKTIHYFN